MDKITEEQINFILQWLKDNRVLLVDYEQIGKVTVPEVDETWVLESLAELQEE